ncbi:tRNA (guanine(9)-N(1))-methyltransferase [Dimargaris cristalligena]|nr:tRNA (guanine(9)-N(1))-methyltransferase [Dimargaris cristalligena]
MTDVPATPTTPSAHPTSDSSVASAAAAVTATTTPAPTDPVAATAALALSKNAQKRLLRQQKWEAGRENRITQRKALRKEKKIRRRELIQNGVITPPEPRHNRFGGEQTSLTVVLDMSFDHLMLDKEIPSTVRQVARCYSDNRTAKRKVNLVVTELQGRTQAQFGSIMREYENWKEITFEPRSYLEVFDKEKLVYLTADSDHTLTTLDEDKGVTHQKASEQGIATARLPIGDFLKMASRKVLTVNQVMEIILKYLETQDWAEAMMQFIPQRKMPQVQGSETASPVAASSAPSSREGSAEPELTDIPEPSAA